VHELKLRLSIEAESSCTGLGLANEAQSIEVLEELCGVCRGQGRWQDAPQQLTDLAELMQSYGFPTPGWTEEEGPGRADSHGDTDMGMGQVLPFFCMYYALQWTA